MCGFANDDIINKLLMETEKTSNQLIADFMGLKRQYESTQQIFIDNLKYDTSWNWLMPVVEKIATLKHPTYIYISHIQKTCSVYELLKGGSGESNNRMIHNSGVKETAIQLTYKSVVEFIKWYNQQSPNS